MTETININYNNKTIVIPKPFNECDFGKNPLEEISVANRFSGESVLLPRFAGAIYDVIMGSEMLKQWEEKDQSKQDIQITS